MSISRTYIAAGVIAALLAAGGVAAGLTASSPAGPIGGAAPVQSVIILDPNNHGEVFAPPPADAAPGMTAQEALDAYEGKHVPIRGYVTVQLGLYTLPVGPDCGPECEHNNIVRGNMVYSVLNKLVYGFSRRVCPAGSDRPDWQCTQWDFIDADTGKFVGGLLPARDVLALPRRASRRRRRGRIGRAGFRRPAEAVSMRPRRTRSPSRRHAEQAAGPWRRDGTLVLRAA